MCVVSMVSDRYTDMWKQEPWYVPQWPSTTDGVPSPAISPVSPGISREEFAKLREEVEELKDWIKRAKKYDEENGEPDCELETKTALIKKIAEVVGIEIDIK